MNRLPTVPCRFLPPVTMLGTSAVRFGSVWMTPYCFVYRASCDELLAVDERAPDRQPRRSATRPGSRSRISFGLACAYVERRLIARRKLRRELRVPLHPAVQRAVAADRPELAEHRSRAPSPCGRRRSRICERNGSGVQTASTWPLFSAARISGNPSASRRTEFGSTPTLLQRGLDHHLADALERVDGDRLAREVGRRRGSSCSP